MGINLNLKIITPAKISFTGEVQSVTIPGTVGSFQILKDHAPLISTFEIGLLKVEKLDKTIDHYATCGGTVEVLNNEVMVLADAIELAEEIDVERAEKAKQRAEERLSTKEPSTDIERAQTALKRAVNRLEIVEKYFAGLKTSVD
jgi:F-type H+-transporting ATPase subunit epsilon